MENKTAYFKDIFAIKPFHYDCTLGKLVLPWNNQVIDIFKDDNGPQPVYRPVVDGVYAEESSYIYMEGESFTKNDLDEYLHRVQEYNKQKKLAQQKRAFMLYEVSGVIKKKLQSSMIPLVKVLDGWALVHSGSYAILYDTNTNKYQILRFNSEEPIERRYYWWNRDESFEPITSEDRNEIADEFVKLVKQEIYQLFSMLLYQDENCKCYFSKVLHYNLVIEDRRLPFTLTVDPSSQTLYAECQDSRFSYSEKGMCPPTLTDGQDKWDDFCKELSDKLIHHVLNMLS